MFIVLLGWAPFLLALLSFVVKTPRLPNISSLWCFLVAFNYSQSPVAYLIKSSSIFFQSSFSFCSPFFFIFAINGVTLHDMCLIRRRVFYFSCMHNIFIGISSIFYSCIHYIAFSSSMHRILLFTFTRVIVFFSSRIYLHILHSYSILTSNLAKGVTPKQNLAVAKFILIFITLSSSPGTATHIIIFIICRSSYIPWFPHALLYFSVITFHFLESNFSYSMPLSCVLLQ